jgi:hypothetical protein
MRSAPIDYSSEHKPEWKTHRNSGGGRDQITVQPSTETASETEVWKITETEHFRDTSVHQTTRTRRREGSFFLLLERPLCQSEAHRRIGKKIVEAVVNK